MIVVATLFSIVATTIIPHHHHNNGEIICLCHHISCCHETEECCTHQEENHSKCSDCMCNIKISIEQTNQLVKAPTPILLPTLDIYSEALATLLANIQAPYKDKGNFPPNLIHKYIFYRNSIALRAPPQF